MSPVTIIPEDGNRAESLGELMSGALYDDFRHWTGILAFNLCMGALLWAAARVQEPVVLKMRPLDPEDEERVMRVLAQCRNVGRAILIDSEIVER